MTNLVHNKRNVNFCGVLFWLLWPTTWSLICTRDLYALQAPKRQTFRYSYYVLTLDILEKNKNLRCSVAMVRIWAASAPGRQACWVELRCGHLSSHRSLSVAGPRRQTSRYSGYTGKEQRPSSLRSNPPREREDIRFFFKDDTQQPVKDNKSQSKNMAYETHDSRRSSHDQQQSEYDRCVAFLYFVFISVSFCSLREVSCSLVRTFKIYTGFTKRNLGQAILLKVSWVNMKIFTL